MTALHGIDDVPGYAHGIVNDSPFTIRCDGCGLEAVEGGGTNSRTTLVLTCGIIFNPTRTDDGRRLCRGCRKTEWPER